MNVGNFFEAWAPGAPGTSFKASATAGAASAAVQIRAAASLGGFVTPQPPLYVTFASQTTTAGPGFHIAFGDSNVAAPTAADMLINDASGWVRVMIPATVTHFRIFAEGTTVGSVYLYTSGKQN